MSTRPQDNAIEALALEHGSVAIRDGEDCLHATVPSGSEYSIAPDGTTRFVGVNHSISWEEPMHGPALRPGRVIALALCLAYADGTETTISGLFTLEEYHVVEPSSYVWSPCWTVSRVEDADHEDATGYDIDANVLFEQVDPVGYGRYLCEERFWELRDEDEVVEAGR